MGPKVLPSVFSLPGQPTARRHSPIVSGEGERGYEVFRSCLRWEFGFVCAFCLLHEAQLSPLGAKGSGVFWIEHIELRSARPDLINSYANVVYTCKLCNLARGRKPKVTNTGVALLDPTTDAWSQHFEWRDDNLSSLSDRGAATLRAYDLNSPQKVRLRKETRDALLEAVEVLSYGPTMLAELLADIDALPTARRPVRLRTAALLHSTLARARRTLALLAPVPLDADPSCHCKNSQHCTLPAWLAVQLIEIAAM